MVASTGWGRTVAAMTTRHGVLDEQVNSVIDQYNPRGRKNTAQVAEFARSAVRKASPVSRTVAQNWLSIVAAFADWAAEQGHPLDDRLWNPVHIERFVAVGMTDKASQVRASYRSALRRIGRRVAPTRFQAEPPRLGRSGSAVPYSDDELAALLAAAEAQPTRHRRDSVMAFICLGAGAGLRPAEMRDLKGVDIVRVGATVAVRLPDRTVPLLPELGRRLWKVAQRRGEGLLLGGRPGSKNVSNRVTASFKRGPGVPRLEWARLQATWRLTVLQAAGLREILAAFGTRAPSSLFALVAQLPEPDPDQVFRRLVELYGGSR